MVKKICGIWVWMLNIKDGRRYNSMKTLLFEGVGWADADISKATDVGNCRIRTRLRNNVGRVIYLEILCCHFENKNIMPKWMGSYNYGAIIDSIFYYDAWWDRNRNLSRDLQALTDIHFEYNKANILKFVNDNLNCSFDNIEVDNNMTRSVFSLNEPLCDCSDGDYEPYKDIEVNITELDGVIPAWHRNGSHYAKYKMSYNSMMKLPYMKKYLESISEAERSKIQNDELCAYFTWNNEGIITCLELHAGCCMGVGAEDIMMIIDLIKTDNRNVVTA